MRKLAVVGAAVAAFLAFAAVALAAQVNTYGVDGSTTPGKPGTKKKPVAIQLKFGYQVGEQSGQRPSPVKRYTIGFYGVRSNGRYFAKCTAAQINAAQSDKGCPKAAVVGTGSVTNAAGQTADPNDKSLPCNLNLKIYNSGQGKAALYLYGTPPQCVIPISQAIDAKYVSFPGGTALQFDVPSNLLHPVTGVDNAVTNVTSTIKRLKAKGHGYYESVGCKGGKRPIQVSFLTEAGQSSKATGSASC